VLSCADGIGLSWRESGVKHRPGASKIKCWAAQYSNLKQLLSIVHKILSSSMMTVERRVSEDGATFTDIIEI
jgi:hypothetical protein